MSEREALMRAICDNPDDDTPRLVFADWLDEHGEPARAEFIRAQIDLDRLQPLSIPWHKAGKQVRRLLVAHEARWRAEVPVRDGFRWTEFRHGFLDQLIAPDFAAFQSNAAAIFAATPVRELFLGQVQSLTQLGLIVGIERPSRIRVFAHWATPDDVRGFLSSPGGTTVKRLEMENGVGNEESLQLLRKGLRQRLAVIV